MSHLVHSDGESNILRSGGVVVRQENSYSEYDVVDWSSNVEGQDITFATQNSEQVKFYLRRTSRNERIEDIVINWTELASNNLPVVKFPTFFHLIEQVRVLINNVEIVDIKHHEIIQNIYRTNLFVKRGGSESEADFHWNWIVNRAVPTNMIINNNTWNVPFVDNQNEVAFSATMNDILPGVFENFPIANGVNFIEIQFRLLSPLYTSYLGGSGPGDVNQIIHSNIRMYSKHKSYSIPIPKKNFILQHQDCEVLRINPPFNFQPAVNGGGRIELDISKTFIGDVRGIQRIIVYRQETTPSVDSPLHFSPRGIRGLSLYRNGQVVQGTDFFYGTIFDIAYQTEKYYKRRYAAIHGGKTVFAGGIYENWNRVTPGDVNFGRMFPQCFIDTTCLIKHLNEGTDRNTSVYDASVGISNNDNLILRIECDIDFNLDLDRQLIVLLEFNRYAKLFPNGDVKKVTS
jgi:hypothetical protein